MPLTLNKCVYTYNNIHNQLFKLVKKLKKYKPDILIAISSGGLIPGKILKSFLNLPLYIVSVKSYDENHNQLGKIDIIQWCHQDFSDKKILLIDEIDDTRKTLEFCTKKLKSENNPDSIAICVVHNKIGTLEKNIEYFSALEVDDEWIEYPWEHQKIL